MLFYKYYFAPKLRAISKTEPSVSRSIFVRLHIFILVCKLLLFDFILTIEGYHLFLNVNQNHCHHKADHPRSTIFLPFKMYVVLSKLISVPLSMKDNI